MTIREVLEKNAIEKPSKIYFYYDEMTHTYSEMDRFANRVANGLASLGAKKGDHVCLLLTNIPEFIYCMYGTTKSGMVFIPINPALQADEVLYILNNCEAKYLVVEGSHLELIRSIRDKCEYLKDVLVVGKEISKDELMFSEMMSSTSDDPPSVKVVNDDVASIIYTSGTTGRPKGAMLTHGNYMFDASAIVKRAQMTENDRFMCILPLFHVNGQVATTLAPLYAGGSMVLVHRFSASTFFQTVDKFKPTAFSAVPTIYAMLLNTPGTEQYDLKSLRFCICGAAPMPVEVFKNFEKKFNASILEGYGLSEGTCASSVNPLEKKKIGSIGTPLEGQDMKIVDANEKELPPGETGEIVVKGPNVMVGYYKNPEATAATIVNEWLHTGDLGHIDEDGFFYIVGRKKEMIIRGGENIYPKEIEEVLYQHADVVEAAVCGVPDKFYGEEVKAFIQLRPGSAKSEKDYLDYCFSKLARYKCPKSVAFVDEMPKTATGKIQKRKLIEDPRWTAE
ncbi:MAG TPA: long-chain fatty acid--CoA ligase [bacterium]|nr:long-chain fatty acid--CoA ligase [bacterium]